MLINIDISKILNRNYFYVYLKCEYKGNQYVLNVNTGWNGKQFDFKD